MTDDRSLERAARSWLEEGPTQAPEQPVDAALARIQTTSQERDLRIPWRLRTMNPMARLAIVARHRRHCDRRDAVCHQGIAERWACHCRPYRVREPVSTPSPTTGSTGAARTDYSDLDGWIVFEHFGNAPDGSTTTSDPDRRGIWLVHADGSGLHELAPGKPVNGKTSPEISPDGTKVVFDLECRAANLGGADRGRRSRAAFDRLQRPGRDVHGGRPAYSADGTRIAFVRFTGDADGDDRYPRPGDG